MTVTGWAVVDIEGNPVVRSVADTRRAALVNWLWTRNFPVDQRHTDLDIERAWRALKGDHVVVEVIVTPLVGGALSGPVECRSDKGCMLRPPCPPGNCLIPTVPPTKFRDAYADPLPLPDGRHPSCSTECQSERYSGPRCAAVCFRQANSPTECRDDGTCPLFPPCPLGECLRPKHPHPV